jgi:glycosidase
MPDLNYDNKNVRDEMKKIAKFYLDMGIDGFRLDAAMHIYNDDDKNVQWWKEFNDYVKSVNKDAVLVGEVWNDTNLISHYAESLDSSFNFPVSDSIIRMVATGKTNSYDTKISGAYKQYDAKNKNFIDAPFLTNHDQDRAMSVLGTDERAKKAAAIYLTLPGTPFIYYGEETGMTGKKPDEAIRQPFIWDNKDKTKNSSWEGSTNDIDKVAVNVQLTDKESLLNFYRQIISIRNSSDALKYGDFELVDTEYARVFAFKRTYNNKSDYVFVNLGNADAQEKASFDNAKVVYSSKGTTGSINGNVNVKANEILILEK